MADGNEWLELLVRDAPVEEFTALGVELTAQNRPGAGATGTALELKSMLQQRAQHAGELSALNDVAGRLAALHAPEDLLPEVVAQARRLLRVDLAYLGLLEEGRESAMRIAVSDGALTPDLIGLHVDLSTSMAGQVITQASPRWVSDYRSSAAFRHDEKADAAADAENMRGLLGVPLSIRGQVLGALFACKRSERHFSEHEVVLLSGLAAHAAIALDNARMIGRLAGARDELALRTSELERAAAWNHQLTQLVLRGGGVVDLLAELTAAATVPVRFVRRAELDKAEDPEDQVVAAALRAAPVPDGPVHADHAGSRLVIRRVMAGNRDFGVLVMRTAQPRSEDVFLVDQAAPVLALALVADEAVADAGRHARDSLLAELLTAPGTDPTRISQLAQRAGLDLGAEYVVVVADPSASLLAAREQTQSLGWPAGTMMAGCQGRLVLLVPTMEPGVVERIWDDHDLPRAGMAGPAAPGPQMVACYREAVQTVEALGALALTSGVRTASQLGLFRLLLQHTGRHQVDQEFERTLAAVAREQERRGVPLLETLERYLAEGQRPRPAARTLGIHVNTLYQRLASLDTVLGDDWRDTDRALELQLLLRLRRAVTRLERSGPVEAPSRRAR